MRAEIEAGVHTYVLSGSARAVIKQKSNIPLVTIAIGARAGIHNESAANCGLTGLVARASLKGTTTRTGARIAQLAEDMGGGISPSVSADVIDWEITVPARHFATALDLIVDVAFNASFPDSEFEVERKLALSDLQQTRDDMYRYPLRLCMQQAFHGHAYGNTLEAVEHSLSRATRGAAAAWYSDQLRHEPWVFVVGAVEPDAAARAIEAVIPQTNGVRRTAPGSAAWQGGTTRFERRDKAQTALALAFPGPARADDDVYALQVLANAVGGLGGRIFEELRSKRSLAYSVALLPIARWLGGAFVAYIATAPEREAEARSALLEEIERLVTEPLPPEDVRRSQRYTIGTWQIRSQTNGAQLGDLLHACLLGKGVAEILEFEDRVRAVTPADINRAAHRYFNQALMVEGIVRGKDQQ
ncbi:MAG: M16 family metallopeptidase [Gemmatimonadota bacterium]